MDDSHVDIKGCEVEQWRCHRETILLRAARYGGQGGDQATGGGEERREPWPFPGCGEGVNVV